MQILYERSKRDLSDLFGSQGDDWEDFEMEANRTQWVLGMRLTAYTEGNGKESGREIVIVEMECPSRCGLKTPEDFYSSLLEIPVSKKLLIAFMMASKSTLSTSIESNESTVLKQLITSTANF